jgi:hypothetical protein
MTDLLLDSICNLTLKMIKFKIPIFMKVIGMSIIFQMQLVSCNLELKTDKGSNLKTTKQSHTLLSWEIFNV